VLINCTDAALINASLLLIVNERNITVTASLICHVRHTGDTVLVACYPFYPLTLHETYNLVAFLQRCLLAIHYLPNPYASLTARELHLTNYLAARALVRMENHRLFIGYVGGYV
jgi:hypothetical protein